MMEGIEAGKVLNENLQNTAPSKAVPCDIIKEIFKARDAILASKDDELIENYEADYEEFFKEYEEKGSESDDYILGNCCHFLESCFEQDRVDVVAYATEYYLADEGKYQGICKLPNGAEIIVFLVYCEEQPSTFYQVLYFDGTELRVFTPFSGNVVNAVTMTALGDEYYTAMEEFDSDLYNQIYPNGLTGKRDGEFHEMATLGYLKFLGYTEEEFYKGLRPNKELIDREIEIVLS